MKGSSIRTVSLYPYLSLTVSSSIPHAAYIFSLRLFLLLFLLILGLLLPHYSYFSRPSCHSGFSLVSPTTSVTSANIHLLYSFPILSDIMDLHLHKQNQTFLLEQAVFKGRFMFIIFKLREKTAIENARVYFENCYCIIFFLIFNVFNG